MTEQTEAVRAWLTAKRETMRQHILDLQTYQQAIDWLLGQLPPPTPPEVRPEAPEVRPAPETNGHHATPQAGNRASVVLSKLNQYGQTGATAKELTARLNGSGVPISAAHVSTLLSAAKARKQVRQLPHSRWATL